MVNVCDQHPDIEDELAHRTDPYIVMGTPLRQRPRKNYPCESRPGLDWLQPGQLTKAGASHLGEVPNTTPEVKQAVLR